MFYCDTNWHNGVTTDADYLLLPEESDEGAFFKSSFACCEGHLIRAMHVMHKDNKLVRVRRVNKDREGAVHTDR
jgi:hypothetical protein